MNGEVGLVCRLTATARLALRSGEFSYRPTPYEHSVTFTMAEREKPAITVRNPEMWFAKLKEYDISDIFMITNCRVQNLKHIGFANATGTKIFARFADGTTSCFFPTWTFDKKEQVWNIAFREEIMKDAPAELPQFNDNTEDFKKILKEMSALAEKLEFEGFANAFMSAYTVLDGAELPEIPMGEYLPNLPEDKKRIYIAADFSDVFGAMGSWNDSPAYAAFQKGLEHEYNDYSNSLYAQNRYALMYAVNCC